MEKILDTLVLVSTDHLPQTVADLRDVDQADLADRICTSVSCAIAALGPQDATTSTTCPENELSDRLRSCEGIIAEVDSQAERKAGWNSPAWQECKIYAHM